MTDEERIEYFIKYQQGLRDYVRHNNLIKRSIVYLKILDEIGLADQYIKKLVVKISLK